MPERMQGVVHAVDRLEVLMDVLRERCPWDKEQTLASLRRHTLEEVHEVLEAIDTEDWQGLKNELGDLLLQIVFYACIAKEKGQFALHDIAEAIVAKMMQRHPHVFADARPADLARQWEELKAAEHTERASLMDGVPPLPALAKAQKVQKRAARAGFDWVQTVDVLDKMHEELAELEAEVLVGHKNSRVEEEFGDLLFTLANLARKLGIDAELALMRSNRKFMQRFRLMEQLAQEKGLALEALDLTHLEDLYEQVKAQEQSSGS